MIIGSDFQPIQFDFFGLSLLEPNAFIGDILLFGITFVFYVKIQKTSPFNIFWSKFFFYTGVSFLLGGFGHLLFNYTGLFGKSFSWFFGIIATFFVEQAMISIWRNQKQRNKMEKYSRYKFYGVLIAEMLYLISLERTQDPALGLLLPALNAIIGLGFSVIYLGSIYQKTLHQDFRYFWIGALIIFPNGLIQALKINIHPWFDRNDLAHVLLMIGFSCFYLALVRINRVNHTIKQFT